MRRRDFLKSNAIGILVPGAIKLQDLSAGDQESGSNKTAEKPGASGFEQKMHPDFMTYMEGIEYFYLGNGDIQGAVQYCPKDSRGTFLGFTLMDPGVFCRKWSTYLYHPERGLSATRVGVTLNELDDSPQSKGGMYYGVRGFAVSPENFKTIQWKYPDGVPVVSLKWMAGECEIEEEFFVPSEGALLFRRVNVHNLSGRELRAAVGLSQYANFGLFDEIRVDEKKKIATASGLARMQLQSLDAEVSVAGRYDVRVDLGKVLVGETKRATYVYSINGGERALKKKTSEVLWKETTSYWNATSTLVSGNDAIDNLFNMSKCGLRAVVERHGKMDAGTWMYNMEWVSDQLLAVEGLLRFGFVNEARAILERNLKTAIGPDGRTIESSRWFGFDYTELNQNGILLYGTWAYLCWTGDVDLIKKYWNKIRLCAEFPLMDVFLDKNVHLVRNKREFWERSDPFGFEEGYEMAYQFWVAFGLEKGAAIAAVLGKKKIATRWLDASSKIKAAMLDDPKFRFIEDGHLIKRRTLDGRWQRYVVPPDLKRMPPGSPIATEEKPSPDPDTVEMYPIVFGMIDPHGELSLNTLRWVEPLWNQRWDGGGYPRYNVTSEDNPPAPWPLASVLVARAYAETGDDAKVWRVIDWLHNTQGGKSGSWFERLGQSITPPMPPVGVVGWIWYEIAALFIQHIIGMRPELDHLLIRPYLLKGLDGITSNQTVRGSNIALKIRRTTGASFALVNGRKIEIPQGALKLPFPLERNLSIEMNLAER